ncbi:hypothetical protein AHAS_Ahas09G0145900 [Arachis hypogaea]
MATRGRGWTHTWRDNKDDQPADNHAEFMAAMTNLANLMQASVAATTQAIERLGQPTKNGNRKGTENNLVGAPITLATFLKTQHVLDNEFVRFAAYQLMGKAQHLWQEECRLLQLQNTDIHWDLFQTVFYYNKYFLESVREDRELELMQLKQGSMFIAKYTSRFEDHYRFLKVCLGASESYEGWKRIKYQGGLWENIMAVVASLEI